MNDLLKKSGWYMAGSAALFCYSLFILSLDLSNDDTSKYIEYGLIVCALLIAADFSSGVRDLFGKWAERKARGTNSTVQGDRPNQNYDIDALERLYKLKITGALSESEYEAEKRKILKN